MDQQRLAVLFNEWMRRYIADPEQFGREFQSVQDFLAEQRQGKVPTYGESCAAYLEQLNVGIAA
jgi:hypothetical protein